MKNETFDHLRQRQIAFDTITYYDEMRGEADYVGFTCNLMYMAEYLEAINKLYEGTNTRTKSSEQLTTMIANQMRNLAAEVQLLESIEEDETTVPRSDETFEGLNIH